MPQRGSPCTLGLHARTDPPRAHYQVGAYYKGGLTAIDGVVVEGYDRAAPSGVGHIKAAGNYAPDVLPSSQQKALGYPICLYLDAKENAYVEEFSTSNFLGVTKDGAPVTSSNTLTLTPTLNLTLTLNPDPNP